MIGIIRTLTAMLFTRVCCRQPPSQTSGREPASSQEVLIAKNNSGHSVSAGLAPASPNSVAVQFAYSVLKLGAFFLAKMRKRIGAK